MEEYGRESKFRSILKSCTWRITATITTVTIAYAITGDTEAAFKIGGVEVILKLLIYYIHERIWQLVHRGTIRKMYR
jgi:uncharacterized membrane protein